MLVGLYGRCPLLVGLADRKWRPDPTLRQSRRRFGAYVSRSNHTDG